MKKIIVGMFVAVFAMTLFPIAAKADSFTYDYTVSFGAAPSGGTSPWLQATFSDISPIVEGDATIKLTLETTGILATESVNEWYFTIDGDLLDDGTDGVFATDFEALLGNDDDVASWDLLFTNLQADGDGIYDFKFDFPEGNFADRFIGGEEVIFTLHLDGVDLTLANFENILSAQGGGQGPFLSAAHILATGGGGESDWVAPGGEPVPEPTTMLLLGSGLVGLMLYGRKRFRKETDKTS